MTPVTRVKARREIRVVATMATLTAIMAATNACDAHSSATGQQSDLSRVDEQMLVEQSAFPAISGASWSTSLSDNVHGPSATNPPQCEALQGMTFAKQQAQASLVRPQATVVEISIFPAGDRFDFASILADCATFQDPQTKNTTTATAIAIPEVPEWATAIKFTSEGTSWMHLLGIHRGIEIRAAYSEQHSGNPLDPEIANALGKTFADQAAELDKF